MTAQDTTLFGTKKTIRCGDRLLSLYEPVVMGILNVTPDSFYSGSRLSAPEAAAAKATEMLAEGAAILDLGGYSSRPGADDITVQEELNRVLPAIDAILQKHPDALISIDTFRAEVAQKSVLAGAAIVNDILGGSLDAEMFATVAELQVPYILMHMRGTPQTMQQHTDYDNLLLEVTDYFQQKIAELRALGVKDIILDPGFGFAKTISLNYELFRQMQTLQLFGLPILAGISRKSMVYKALGNTPTDALTGTTALHMAALERGASILRAHDVKEAVQVVQLFGRLQPQPNPSPVGRVL